MQLISPAWRQRSIAASWLCLATTSWAQPAGQLLEESRRQQPPALPAQQSPRVLQAPVRPAINMPEGVAVTVSAFRISGAQSFALEPLQTLLQPWAGKKLDIRGLNEAAGAITRFYQSNGHLLSYAYLPAQRVADGVIEIAVLEGKLEAAQIVTAQDVRLRDEVVQAYTDKLVDATPVLQGAIERQLLLLNEIAGVTARAAFTPGANTGGAEMVVSVAEEEPLEVRAEINNHGGVSTGRYRAGITLQLRDLFGWGDHTVARGYASNRGGLVSGSLNSSLPLGGDGWRLGASLSRLKYELAGVFRTLAAQGTADAAGLDMSYALRRSTDGNLTARAGYEHKRLRDDKDAIGESDRRINHSFEFALNADFRDPLGGVGAIGATGTQGYLRANGAPRTVWRKLYVQGAHQLPLWSSFSLYTRLAAQTTGSNLDSSEKLGLGGASAVRAYSTGEASVDHGALGTLELRYARDFLGGSLVGSLFHDYGGGLINRTAVGTRGNDPELNGSGFGLAWTASGMGVNATLAWRGSRVPTTDTSDPQPRLFLQLFYTP